MARPPPPNPCPVCVGSAAFFGAVSAVWVQRRRGAGPTAHGGAAAIPTVGPAASCTQSNTRPPHCSVCCHQTNLHLRDEKQEGGEVEKSSLFLAGLDNNCSQGRPARATFFFFRVM